MAPAITIENFNGISLTIMSSYSYRCSLVPWLIPARIESILNKIDFTTTVVRATTLVTFAGVFQADVSLRSKFNLRCLPFSVYLAIIQSRVSAQILAVIALVACAYPQKLNTRMWGKIVTKDGVVIILDMFGNEIITFRHLQLFQQPLAMASP